MTGPVIAIVPGGPAVGMCLVVADQVVEGCTVTGTPTRSRSPLDDLVGVAALATKAVTTAQNLVGDAVARGDLVGPPVWVVLGVGVADVSTQRRRAAAGSAHNLRARHATAVSTGAMLAALAAAGIPALVITPSDVGGDPNIVVPQCLSGRVPADWLKRSPARHVGRADRTPQRVAFAVCCAAPDGAPVAPGLPVTRPVTRPIPEILPVLPMVRPLISDREWVSHIRDVLRGAVPTGASHRQVFDAATAALAANPAPESIAAITPVEVATDAVLNAGVTPSLWALPATLLARFTAVSAPSASPKKLRT